ncbi:MAG: hypothetical protein NVS4B3_15770 [Gemmatimonadaceae bacterium]
MNRTIVRTLAAALTLGVAATTAHAQLSYGLAAGASFPTGDVQNAVNTGFNVMGSVAASVPAAPLGFRGDVLYNQFGIKAPGTGNLNILGAIANATFGLPDVILSPYLIGGVGYYHVTADRAPNADKVGINGGIGTRFGLSGFSTYAEVRYHNVYTDGVSTKFIPLTFGIMF